MPNGPLLVYLYEVQGRFVAPANKARARISWPTRVHLSAMTFITLNDVEI